MASVITIHKPKSLINGEVSLTGSKSISNRVLIIQALCAKEFKIDNLSNSKDTTILQKALNSIEDKIDCGHAGTSFRFMTAYLAFKKSKQILTGSNRMKQRPIGDLVDALNQLGANITYLEKKNYPPLLIESPFDTKVNEINISGTISSQYISALALIAPTLPNGLKINIVGNLVSRPYLEMTLSLMAYFGVHHQWTENTITINHQYYIPKDFAIEGDWSSASYLYGLVACNPNSKLTIHNLHNNSVQGDRAIVDYFDKLGVKTTFHENEVQIAHHPAVAECFFADLSNQPDIAQTISAVCAVKGIECRLIGLQTLAIKECDRIIALKTELEKVGVSIKENEAKDQFVQKGKAEISHQLPNFETYEDHRMAMSMSLLSSSFMIKISDPQVVMKSYPQFWDDLESLGFKIIVNT